MRVEDTSQRGEEIVTNLKLCLSITIIIIIIFTIIITTTTTIIITIIITRDQTTHQKWRAGRPPPAVYQVES